jgi:hypothetical protein
LTAGEFALVTRDELWTLAPVPSLLHQRLVHGVAIHSGNEIVANDSLDAECDRLCDEAMESARAAILAAVERDRVEGTRFRLVVSTRREEACRTEVTCALRNAGFSAITDPTHIEEDAALLSRFATRETTGSGRYRETPIVWRNGSAAVLFHEAVGHALEHGQPPAPLPPGWRVDAPLEMRRASFTDVPLCRMRGVEVSFDGETAALPARRIEIHLLSGGHYEPLTETVTIRVAAADLVHDGAAIPLHSFVIRESRADLAAAIAGGFGEPQRYPGVICSREGQDLFVASAAPGMVMEF